MADPERSATSPAPRAAAAPLGLFTRRHLAVQAGDRFARFLLARRRGPTLRVERIETIDLRREGLLTPEETAHHLRGVLTAFPASAPVALALPLGRALSQVIDVGPGEARAHHHLAQTVGGRQFEQVPSLFDSRPLRPFAGHDHPMWVTIAREADVELQLLRCGIDAGRVSHVTSADGALAAAFALQIGAPDAAVLIELGSVATAIVVVESCQAVFSASFDTGMGAFIDALAADLGCPSDEAEFVLGRDGDEAVNPGTPQLAAALARWRSDLEALLAERARESGRIAGDLLALPRWFSGVAFVNPLLRDLVEKYGGGNRAHRWPDVSDAAGRPVPLSAHALAWGTAAVGLGVVPTPANLMPPTAQRMRRVATWTGWLHVACLVALAVGACSLVNAIWARHRAVAAKQERVALLQRAKEAGPRLAEAEAARDRAYFETVSVLYFQKRTRDLLAGVRALRAQRVDDGFWYAVVADAESYATGAPPVTAGAPGAVGDALPLRQLVERPTGLIVELSLPPETPDKLGAISRLAEGLRASGVFSGIDILPARARRSLADPAVLAPDSDFALGLEAPPFEHSLPPPPAPSAGGGLFSRP